MTSAKIPTPLLHVGAIGLLVLASGCSSAADKTRSQTLSTTALIVDPTLQGSAVECVGSLHFDTTHDAAGESQCRNGHHVPFSAHTDSNLSLGLICTYTLSYSDPATGTGQIVCNDDSKGNLTFEDTDRKHGLATAHMTDGREISLFYTRT